MDSETWTPQDIWQRVNVVLIEISSRRVRKALYYSIAEGDVRNEAIVNVFYKKGGTGLKFVFKPPVYQPEIRETAEYINAWMLLQLGDENEQPTKQVWEY